MGEHHDGTFNTSRTFFVFIAWMALGIGIFILMSYSLSSRLYYCIYGYKTRRMLNKLQIGANHELITKLLRYTSF